MKIFSYELKRDNYEVKYTVKAEDKDKAIKKIERICGERVTKVKEL